MKIRVTFFSILADWVGVPEAMIELPHGATFGELLAVVGRRYRCNMPSQLWDDKIEEFSSPVTAFKNGIRMVDRDTRIEANDHIRFLLGMGGG